MANTFKFGNGNWAVKDGYALAYNDENNNFKPLPFDFTRASSATRVNKQGLIETVPSGKPRIDFLNNTNGHLLLEPSRTNLLTYSNDFTQTGWDNSTYPVTVTSNSIVSPDGTQNAALLTPTSGNSRHSLRNQTITAVSGTEYVLSGFYKKGGSRYVVLSDAGDASWHVVTADLDNGTITSEANATGTITDYGNGWYRITCKITRGSGGTIQFSVGSSETDTNSALPSFDDTSLTTYFYGSQVEEGRYATSYIPTEGSSVTRVAETCNGAGNDSLFSEAEGVLYVESEALANDETSRVIASISNGSATTNRVVLQYTNNVGGNQVVAFAQTSSGYSSVLTRSITNALTFNKFAVVYNDSTNNFDLWVNGTKIGDGSLSHSFTANTLTTIQLADGNATGNPFYGRIKEVKVYNTALTDTELQNLTS